MSRELHAFPGGLQLAPRKEVTGRAISIQHPLPERMFLPLQQHIGIASRPLVKIGDRVLKGQKIASADGYVSVPMHASTSGKISDIGDYPVAHPLRKLAPCIVIEPDGDDRWFDIQPTHGYASVDPKALQEVIRECGIIGLGGAGFPAHVKLNEGVNNAVDTLIINGVECEPYISCDDRLIQEKAGYIVAGAAMIRHAVQARHCVIAVEDDMQAAFDALAELIDEGLELVKVPTRYPAGGEKQLIQVLTGIEVPSGGLPIHAGVVIHNVATAAAVYRAVTRGEPTVSRYVTVTGLVAKPRNLQVLLGTPVKDCLLACGYEPDTEHKVILGGPMMGMHVRHPDIPVTKTTNCVLVRENIPPPPEMPCIRCGDCVDVCPIRLQPQQLYWHARSENFAAAQDYHLFDCIECGCCAYACPSHIPLVQYYRYAKAEIAEQERRQAGADHARSRFLARNERLEKQQQAAGEPGVARSAPDDKQAYIAAAVKRAGERTKERRKRSAPDSRLDAPDED